MASSVPAKFENRTQLITDAAHSIANGQLKRALRLASRAQRLSPPNSEATIIVARLLVALGDPQAAVRHILAEHVSVLRPELDATLIDAFLLSGRPGAAREHLHLALQRHSVEEGSDIALAAHRLISADPGERGWVGLRGDMLVIGELRPEEEAELNLALNNDPLSLQAFRASGDGFVNLLTRKAVRENGRVVAEASGKSFVGSALMNPPNFRVRGRCQLENGKLVGWLEIGWSQNIAPKIDLVGAGGLLRTVSLTKRDYEHGGYSLDIDLKEIELPGGRVGVFVHLPNGEIQELSDSPALARPPPAPKPTPVGGVASDELYIDIVIPVFTGRAQTLACLASVLTTCRSQADIIVIDDGSPDSELKSDLDEIARSGRIRLVRNTVNRGFPHAVNRGLSVHPTRDIVVLNADTEVYGDWLARLSKAAYSSRDIGTVTPLSNSGSITSYPSDAAFQSVTSATANQRDRWAKTANVGMTVDIPTGVGFCLYIKRECLNATGPFDGVTFGRGYGEENDFCMRAAAIGWRHVAATNIYIRHLGSASFGEQRVPLQERNSRLLSIRHPTYDALVAEHHQLDPLQRARRNLAELEIKEASRPLVLVICSRLGGGVDRFVDLRCENFSNNGLDVLTLQPANGATIQLKKLAPNPIYDLVYKATELEDAIALLGQLDIQSVELHHFIDLPSQWIDQITRHFSYSVYIHDYSWYCPRISLLGGDGLYCQEPELLGCQICIRNHGSSIDDGDDISALRARSHRWLLSAQRVVTASEDTAARYRRHFPDVKTTVEPWEINPPFHLKSPVPSKGEDLRVAVVGAVGEQKGSKILLSCAQDAQSRGLPIEYVIVGFSDIEEDLKKTERVVVLGRYAEDELQALLSRESPHIGFLPSVTPETWSYTLTHLLAAGIEPVAFDLGVVAERLRRSGLGRSLIPLNWGPSQINDYILSLVFNRALNTISVSSIGQTAINENHEAPQTQVPVAVNGDRKRSMIESDMSMQATPPSIRASAQLVSLDKGIYMFSVDPTSPRGSAGLEMAMPTISLAPAPGSDAGTFQFLGGLKADGAWLTEPRDIQIIRVTTGHAMLLMTSYSAPNMKPLSIQIERVDPRSRPSDQAGQQPSAFRAPHLSAPTAIPTPAFSPSSTNETSARGFRVQIIAHIANRGDVVFTTPWAGAVNERLPIEAFSIAPLEGVAPKNIEYMAVLADGTETPWVDGGVMCGTQRQRMSLTGFAVRSKAGRGRYFEVGYSGRFTSGRFVGPKHNGEECRSTTPGDALYALSVDIREQEQPRDFTPEHLDLKTPPFSGNEDFASPRFGIFRE